MEGRQHCDKDYVAMRNRVVQERKTVNRVCHNQATYGREVRLSDCSLLIIPCFNNNSLYIRHS